MGYGFESKDPLRPGVLGANKCRSGDTALHLAVRNDKLKCCRLLLGLGASRSGVKNGDGNTPADVSNNPMLDKLLNAPVPAAPRIVKVQVHRGGTQTHTCIHTHMHMQKI